MDRNQLVLNILEKKSYLCIGLDTDFLKLPRHLLKEPNPVFEFNKQIIDSTKDHCVAYKINTAFYEAMGLAGWEAMEKTIKYIPSTHFTIADAKRGDIGNSSAQYAKAFFDTLAFDAITVAPYMGEDSIRPFLDYPNKWTIVLCLTSNEGANDFEMLKTSNSFVYEKVLEKVSGWGTPENLMFVVGATNPSLLGQIRAAAPDHFLLVPGVGAQGGSLREISVNGLNSDVGLLVNVSRAIIYASPLPDFAKAAAAAARIYHEEMKTLLAKIPVAHHR